MILHRVVVTGSRRYTDARRITADLEALVPFGLVRVAQGGDGVDRQFGNAETPRRYKSADALAWLAAGGLHLEVKTYRVNREPDELGTWTGADGKWPAAGPRRNRRMLKAERPGLVLAYPLADSRGTWDCTRAALQLGIPVVIWAAEGVELPVDLRARVTQSAGRRHILGADAAFAAWLVKVFGGSDATT